MFPTGRVFKCRRHLEELHKSGVHAITIKDALSVLTDRERPKGKEASLFLGIVRRDLKKNNPGLLVISVTVEFFKGTPTREPYLERPPETEDEAMDCIPGGLGHKTGGLWFPEERCLITSPWLQKFAIQGKDTYVGKAKDASLAARHGVIPRSAENEMAEIGASIVDNLANRVVSRIMEEFQVRLTAN